MEERSTGTSSPPSSFVIKFRNGHEGLRHKSYLKHEVLHTDDSAVDSLEWSKPEKAPFARYTRFLAGAATIIALR